MFDMLGSMMRSIIFLISLLLFTFYIFLIRSNRSIIPIFLFIKLMIIFKLFGKTLKIKLSKKFVIIESKNSMITITI